MSKRPLALERVDDLDERMVGSWNPDRHFALNGDEGMGVLASDLVQACGFRDPLDCDLHVDRDDNTLKLWGRHELGRFLIMGKRLTTENPWTARATPGSRRHRESRTGRRNRMRDFEGIDVCVKYGSGERNFYLSGPRSCAKIARMLDDIELPQDESEDDVADSLIRDLRVSARDAVENEESEAQDRFDKAEERMNGVREALTIMDGAS